MSEDLRLILEVHKTMGLFGEEGLSEMQIIAICAYDPKNKFKHVVVPLRGVNGNTMVVLGTVRNALEAAGATEEEIFIFLFNAMNGDYEHAKATVVEWVTVSDEIPPTIKNDAWSAFERLATKE